MEVRCLEAGDASVLDAVADDETTLYAFRLESLPPTVLPGDA